MRYLLSETWNTQGIIRLTLRNKIFKALIEAIPAISQEEAVFMANIAFEDYINYLKYRHNLLASEESQSSLEELLRLACTWTREHEKSLKEWLKVWLQKWRERVRIVFSDKDMANHAEGDPKVDVKDIKEILGRVKYVKELRDYIIGSLIEHKEYCMTSFLATEIIKNVVLLIKRGLGSTDRAIDFMSRNPLFVLEHSFKLVNRIVRKLHLTITIKVDKSFLEDLWVSRS